jgi:catechol 2,3-dioxygenase
VLLPDRAALGRFLRHVVGHGIHPGAADHLVSEALYLTDPDGLTVEVYRDLPRSHWRPRGAELEMASDPLDFDAVVAAGEGQPWTGAPDGTRIGHMHFYVGDLADAEAFYHRGLGLDKIVWSYPGALFLSAGGYHHHVGTNTWAAGAPVATPDDAGLVSWELRVPDAAAARAAAASLAGAGYRADAIDDAVRAVDPWGITVVVTPRAKSTP